MGRFQLRPVESLELARPQLATPSNQTSITIVSTGCWNIQKNIFWIHAGP